MSTTDPVHIPGYVVGTWTLDPVHTEIGFVVRHMMVAAGDVGVGLADAIATVSSRVIGIDLHPVADTLTRVTYPLTLGGERRTPPDRGTLAEPVHLGDSLGWRVTATGAGNDTVGTAQPASLHPYAVVQKSPVSALCWPVVAAVFVAQIGAVTRFPAASKLTC